MKKYICIYWVFFHEIWICFSTESLGVGMIAAEHVRISTIQVKCPPYLLQNPEKDDVSNKNFSPAARRVFQVTR